MKKIAALLTAFMTLMSLAACSDTAKDDNLFAENNTADLIGDIDKSNTKDGIVSVIESVPVETMIIVDNVWSMITEEELYDECEVIADVTINSLEEVGIPYTCMGAEGIAYKTLAAVSLNTIYYSDYENISQEFIVAIPNSSHHCYEDFPETAVGERCILFISSTNGVEDSLKIYNYADYYLSHPANIINIDGLECTADNIFSAYSSSSALEISGRCSMPLNDFENTLIARINEKNKEYGNQDNNSNVSLGEKSILEISDTNDFTITAEKASPTGIEMKISNNSPKTLYWGSWFTVEKKENDGWYELNLLELEGNDVKRAWTDILAFLDSNETRNIEQQWENGYGELPKGDYRIVKDFFFDVRNQDEKIYVACEFSIEE